MNDRDHVLVEPVLGASLDSSGLDTENTLVRGLSSEERISTKAFPVTATGRHTSHVHGGTKSDVDTYTINEAGRQSMLVD